MKLKMLVSMAGVDWSCSPGDEREFSDAEAVRLIAAGYAEAIRSTVVEKATAVLKREKAVTTEQTAG